MTILFNQAIELPEPPMLDRVALGDQGWDFPGYVLGPNQTLIYTLSPGIDLKHWQLRVEVIG